MSISTFRNPIGLVILVVGLAACGGAGDHIASTASGAFSAPPPPPPPPPSSPSGDQTVILAEPGAAPITTLTASGTGAELTINYDSVSGLYSVSTAELANQQLRESDSYPASEWGPYYFNFGPPVGDSFFHVSSVPDEAGERVYNYSNLATWGQGAGAYWDIANYTAFGQVTPEASVPVTGSAHMEGMIAGSSDIMLDDNLIGDQVPTFVGGTVDLEFDFAAGTLAGSIDPYLSAWSNIDLPSLAFTDTIYSAGSNAYSGSFATALEGDNFFSGFLTGPNAEEAIGKWAFPFELPEDGSLHQAWGAWIARREP